MVENSLAQMYPELIKEWHPTKNGCLTPDMVAAGSGKKVWWMLPYDDPLTGKHFDFEWEAIISNRIKGVGCPYLSGKAVWKGFNDLATTNPDIAKEWHPTKNGDFTPEMVTAHSDKKAWWFLPYDDPNTGKHFVFSWQAVIKNRTRNPGCPFLIGKRVWIGFNDLATTDPEIAKEWHPTKNGNVTPQMVTRSTNKKYWWFLPYDDPLTGKHFDFEWATTVNSRCAGKGCPYLIGKAVYPGFNDFASSFPELAKEWHPTKNGSLTPDMFTVNSYKKVWWLGDCGHEWESTISHRTRGHGCIYCANANPKLLPGLNDFLTVYPEVAKEWHPTKNGDLHPEDVSSRSPKKVWWKGKCGHEWVASVQNRTRLKRQGCPICKKEYKTSFPEQAFYYYIKQSFPDAINGDRKVLSGKELDIYIPSQKTAIEYDGFSWHKKMGKRDSDKTYACIKKGVRLIRIREENLPIISNCEIIIVENDLDKAIQECCEKLGITPDINTERDRAAIVKQYTSHRIKNMWWEQSPDCLIDWDYKKNADLTPYLSLQSDYVWWKCHICGYEWRVKIQNRISGTGCPNCGIESASKAKWKKVRNIDTSEIFDSMKKACDKYGISPANLSACCAGRRKKAGGYRWEFYDL